MDLKIVWKVSTAKYGSGIDAFVGKVKIGSVHWNGIDRDLNKRYVSNFILGSIKTQKFPKEDEGKSFVETEFQNWFKLLTA